MEAIIKMVVVKNSEILFEISSLSCWVRGPVNKLKKVTKHFSTSEYKHNGYIF